MPFPPITLAELNQRIKNEINEFSSSKYKHVFKTCTRLNENTVEVVDYTGRAWVVQRHTMFFFSPSVQRKDDEYVNTSALAWIPTMSAAAWLEKVIGVN